MITLEKKLRNGKRLPPDYLTKKRKKKIKGKEQLILLPFTDEYFEEILDWLYADDDSDLVREFLYGGQGKSLSQTNIRNLFYKYSVSHSVYEPLRLGIKTVYRTLIPIGIAVVTASKGDGKGMLRKFYIEKMWRGKGHEQKGLNMVTDYCISKLEGPKIHLSIYSSNEHLVQGIKEAGFKFSSIIKDSQSSIRTGNKDRLR